MLLSCWRNVIRPWPTVNIHISRGPRRNMRWGWGLRRHVGRRETPVSFALAGEQKRSQLDASGEKWGGLISHPRRWRKRKLRKSLRLFLLPPYRCSHGSQLLCWEYYLNSFRCCRAVNPSRPVFIHIFNRDTVKDKKNSVLALPCDLWWPLVIPATTDFSLAFTCSESHVEFCVLEEPAVCHLNLKTPGCRSVAPNALIHQTGRQIKSRSTASACHENVTVTFITVTWRSRW